MEISIDTKWKFQLIPNGNFNWYKMKISIDTKLQYLKGNFWRKDIKTNCQNDIKKSLRVILDVLKVRVTLDE